MPLSPRCSGRYSGSCLVAGAERCWLSLPVGLLLLSVLVWRAAFSAPDGRLHATLLDLGDGEALLIESPTGRFVLVQGGGARLEALAGRTLLRTGRDGWIELSTDGEQLWVEVARNKNHNP